MTNEQLQRIEQSMTDFRQAVDQTRRDVLELLEGSPAETG
jgi:hypothetical protein